MAVRRCPLCMGKNPVGAIVVSSDTILCSRCGKPLEVARPSRLIATTIGLLAAFLVYRLTRNSDHVLGWALPMVYAILTWGTVAAAVLMLTADLRVRAAEPYTETRMAPMGDAHATHH
ncbi:MAG TPA: hypothetical protein VOA41_05735 [Candidatus Dormibacteraeota bacterium]|nr:hypothetical protein [Candidatus Dormibacteraeota bacterium]